MHKHSHNLYVPFFHRMTATLSGFLVCASPPTAATPSLSPVAGTGLWRYIGSVSQTALRVFSCLPNDLTIMACITWHFSDAFFADEGTSRKAQHYNNCGLHWFCWGLAFLRRCGTWPTASWRPTTLVTVATWTQWLCLLMAPCVHLVEGYEIDFVLNDSGDSFWACRFHQWWIWSICIRLMKNQRLFLRDACIFLNCILSGVTCRGRYKGIKPCNYGFGNYLFSKVVSSVVTDMLVSSYCWAIISTLFLVMLNMCTCC